ncbi:DUF4815 domain-containing protein, partial [bacterium]|nr:DUF4815 domain-containing protein [bacterium]
TVDPQVIVVDKYTTSPNNVSVGFKTVETVVDAYADESLYDNASNTTNYTAPGANRLKMTPVLYKTDIDTAAANVDFFSLAEWKEGFPYKENKVTVYSNFADELARRTRDTHGDYVVDRFSVLTKEKSTSNTTHIQAVIDPGRAYINGYRVSTTFNNYLDIARETTYQEAVNQNVSINYGNYIVVNELAGLFNFKAGDQVSLYDTAKTYITSATIGSSGAITPAGTLIGYARIRSLVLNSGYPGTPGCTYRMYLFDVTMNAGKSFRSVRSVYYDGTTFDGIADLVLTYDASSGANIASVTDISSSALLFPVGFNGVRTVEAVTYQYRTVSPATLQLTSGGTLSIGPLASGSLFPYSDGALSAVQKRDIIVFPTSNAVAAANLSGSVTISGANVTGTSTSFGAQVKVGDFVKFTNSSASSVYVQVASIANDTLMTLSTSTTLGGSANGALFYPAMYPLSLEDRSDRTVTISGTSSTLTLNINKTLSATVNAIAVYTVKNVDTSPVTKSVNRNLYVKLHTSNNAATNLGPWALGIPGAIRLKNVYLGSSSTVNVNSTDVTKHFYVDAGDDESAYRTSRLVLRSGGGLTLDANSYLMVKMDAFTTGGAEGYFSIGSYPINDTANLASSSSTINTLEIPETLTRSGRYFDLRDTLDFRPYGANTANLSTTVAGATINPSSTFALSGDDQFFPLPDSSVTFDATYYKSRIDRVVAKVDNTFEVLQGDPSATSPVAPKDITGAITLARLKVPPYPSLPAALNASTLEFASKKIGSDRGTIEQRIKNYTVTQAVEYVNGVPQEAQPRRYTMKDIGKLERRVSNVENAVALSDLEKQIAAKNIPSVANPNQNRFKNGFFVEPFDNYLSADTGNREFAASFDLERSMLKPPTKQINFESSFDTTHANTAAAVVNDTLMLPFTVESFINQSIKSSVVTSDGVQVAFEGTIECAPASFSIQSRGEVTYIPDPQPVSAGGGPGGWGDGGGTGGTTAGAGFTSGWGEGMHAGNAASGDGGGGKVICTALYQLGHLERDIFEWDQKFGLWLQRNDWVAYKGYRVWADILVDYMHGRGKPIITKLMFWKTRQEQQEVGRKMALVVAKILGKPFAYELARRYGQDVKFNPFGWFIVSVGLKICKLIGYIHQRVKQSNSNKAGV